MEFNTVLRQLGIFSSGQTFRRVSVSLFGDICSVEKSVRDSDSQTARQGKSLWAVATGPDWCQHSWIKSLTGETLLMQGIFFTCSSQRYMTTMLESVHVQVSTHAGWAQMHVTACHFIQSVDSARHLYFVVICFTPYPSTPTFNRRKCRTVGPSLKAFSPLNETGNWIHPGDFDLPPHIVRSLLAISHSSLRLWAVLVLRLRDLLGARIAKLWERMIYSGAVSTFHGNKESTDYSPESSVYIAKELIAKFLQRQ